MRRITALVAAALVMGGVLVVAGSGAAGVQGPRITITGATVKTVHVTGFKPGERARITMRSSPGMTRVRHATANAKGRFTATFTHFRMSGCGRVFSVVVTGSMGSHVRLLRRPIPELMCAN